MGSGRVLRVKKLGYMRKLRGVPLTDHIDAISAELSYLTIIREPFEVTIDLYSIDVSSP